MLLGAQAYAGNHAYHTNCIAHATCSNAEALQQKPTMVMVFFDFKSSKMFKISRCLIVHEQDILSKRSAAMVSSHRKVAPRTTQ